SCLCGSACVRSVRLLFLLFCICIVLFVLLFSFFFLISRPPPRSTLFPYTTLFRSANLLFALQTTSSPALPTLEKSAGRLFKRRKDRKSTRLNSSHGSISYAVFCLKKKTHHTQTSSPSQATNTPQPSKITAMSDL